MIVKNVEKKENNTAMFQVEIDAESFEKAVNSAYKRLKGSIYVAGFRKGKAPRIVIEGMYGADVFHDEAVQIIAPEAFEFGVKEAELDNIGTPSIADYNVDENKVLTLTFTTDLYPVVTLGQYKGLEAVYVEPVVTDEEVEKELEAVRKRNARFVDVDVYKRQLGQAGCHAGQTVDKRGPRPGAAGHAGYTLAALRFAGGG